MQRQISPNTQKARGLSLRKQFILYGLSIVLPVLAFGAWAVSNYSRAEREATEQTALWHARDLSKSIEHELRRVADQLATLSGSRALAEGDYERLYRRSAHVAQIFNATMVVRDGTGQQVLNTAVPWGTQLPTSNMLQDGRDDLAAGKTHISNLYVGAVKKRPIVTVSVPIIENGLLTHSISMSLEPENLLKGLGISLPPDGWIAGIADRNKVIIASTHNHQKLIGKPATASVGSGVKSPLHGLTEISTPTGKRVLRAHHRLDLSGWTAAVMLPIEKLEGPFAIRWQTLAAAGAMLLVFASTLAAIMANSLIRQFRGLADQASALVMGAPITKRPSRLKEANEVIHSLQAASQQLNARNAAVRDNEAQLRAVLDGVPIGMFRSDLDKNAIYANTRLCDMANTTMEEMNGRKWLQALPEASRAALESDWAAEIAQKGYFEREFEAISVRRGLGIVHIQFHAVPELDTRGNASGYIGTVTDITKRKRAEQALTDEIDRFKRMTLASPDAVYLHDVTSHEITFLNRSLHDVLGLGSQTPATIGAAVFHDVIASDDVESYQAHMAKMRATADGKVEDIMFRVSRRGRPADVWVHTRSVVFTRHPDGRVNQVLCIATDITAHKQAEQLLAEENDRFKRIALASPDIIYIYDRGARRVSFLNRSLRDSLGFSDGASKARGADEMYELIFEDDLEKAHAHIRGMRDAADGEVRKAPVCRFRAPDGGVRWLENRSVVFTRRADGSAHQILCVATDITESKLNSEAIERSNAELEGRVAVEVSRRQQAQLELARTNNLEAIGRLTGGVAHDFNNMLSIIMTSLQLFKREHGAKVRLDDIDTALAGAETGRRLTQQLLSFARRQPVDPVVIHPGDHLGSIVRWIRSTLGEDIEVRTTFPADLGSIRVEEAGFDSAIINLIMNARDAMPDGGALLIDTGNIRLATHDEDTPAGEYVFLAITDTGTGMPPEVVQQAFDPFFTTKGAHGGGTGLGLSSVYGFARQSRARVEIRSKPGHGTSVVLYFPRTTAAPHQVSGNIDANEVIEGRGQVVLVVEDIPKVRELVARTLDAVGYRTLTADNGVEARQMLESARTDGTRIDAVLSDVRMPGGESGPDLAHWVEDHAPGIAVVLMTAYDDGLQTAQGPVGSPDDRPERRPIVRLRKPFTAAQVTRGLHDAWLALPERGA